MKIFILKLNIFGEEKWKLVLIGILSLIILSSIFIYFKYFQYILSNWIKNAFLNKQIL